MNPNGYCMTMSRPEPTKVLTIAGSDSGGAAGLQADLKTFTVLAAYGMSVITVVTAQNSLEVSAVWPLPAGFVAQQLTTVLTDYGAAAVKTGFIGRVELIETIAQVLAQHRPGPIIIDPVLVNHRGQAMFEPAVTQALIRHLFPLATLVTPNWGEAELLTGQAIGDPAQTLAAIQALGPQAVLLKGQRQGAEMVDWLGSGRDIHQFRAPYIKTKNLHGSGDTLSAAITVFLGRGLPLEQAVAQAQQFTHKAIRGAADWKLGGGHGPLDYNSQLINGE